jgi:hypothetical protein
MMDGVIRLTEATPEPAGFVVKLAFADGRRGWIDLEPYLWGPAFDRIRGNQEYFRRMKVRHGVLTWPDGTDLDTEDLYSEMGVDGPAYA